jgi:DNA-binding CsgD family transcriptional regulator
MINFMEKQNVTLSSGELSYYPSNRSGSFGNLIETKTEEVISVFYLNLNYDGRIYLPLSLFSNKLTPLRAVVKYLKENLSKTNKQISSLINRDPRTVWITYKSAEKAKLELSDDSPIRIPLEIFSDEKLSAFEALVSYLRSLEMNYSEIARALQKNPRTIWTIYARANKKMKKDE